MGAVVAALAYKGLSTTEAARAMLSAAPHRGLQHRVELAGSCAIGICGGEYPPEASIATRDNWAAALVGSLDNWRVLAAELNNHGVHGFAESPAGIALEAFKTWGQEAVGRFRGAFAGVVWDGERLWCFRDQVGFQPLFYRSDANGFYCGSEAKQILAGASLVREPDLDAVELIFYRGTGEDAALKGVKRFPSSALARVERDGRLAIMRYWDPSKMLESARIGVAEARERLVHILNQAVTRAVTGSDAVTLSGGIDSPTVAAFAAPEHLRVSGKPLLAITNAYPNFPSVDEAAHTQQVAEYLGIPLRSHVLAGSPIDDIDAWTSLADGPWDTLPMALAAQDYRLARQLGARTVLTGELAEYVYTIARFLLGHLVWHGRWKALARYTSALRAAGPSWQSVGRRVAKEAIPGFLGVAYTRLANRRNRQMPGWIDVTAIWGSPYRHDLSGSARKRWLEAQLSATRATTSTLEADEICAASCGVFVRRPLVDVDLWEFFLSLPAEVKFPDPVPKSLVRQAMRGRLPDAILDRRNKTVFDAYAIGTADYPAMRRWIDPSQYRMHGVNYDLLRSKLEREDMSIADLLWAYNLVKVHAFLSKWS